MGYHSIMNFYNVEAYLVVQKNVKMQIKIGRFALYSVALTTAITHVDD